MRIRTRVSLVAVLATVAIPGGALAAHLGNNKAELVGTGDPDATGQATVNYSDGTGLFDGSANVDNLSAASSYTFLVRRANGTEVEICDGVSNSQGRFACSQPQVSIPAPGFTTAVIRDMLGFEVATGAFARRGNCREPGQAGSQCEANDAPGHAGA